MEPESSRFNAKSHGRSHNKKTGTSSSASNNVASSPDWPKQVTTIHVKSTLDGSLQPSLFYDPSSSSFLVDNKDDGDSSPRPQDDSLPQDSDDEHSGEDDHSHHHHRPLLIALHTWSNDYKQTAGGQALFAQSCIQHGWFFLHPQFRGSNGQGNPEACGSPRAVQDIVDAKNHVLGMMAKKEEGREDRQEQSSSSNNDNDNKPRLVVDVNRIYVVGVSGGGHMALMLAARFAKEFAAISAWAGIADLQTWWEQRRNDDSSDNKDGTGSRSQKSENKFHASFARYARHIETTCGGKPIIQWPYKTMGTETSTSTNTLENDNNHNEAKVETSTSTTTLENDNNHNEAKAAAAVEECRLRSPLTYLSPTTTTVNLDIYAGVDDGRTGSVPFTHSLLAFRALLSTAWDNNNDNKSNENNLHDELSDGWIREFYRTQRAPPTSSQQQQQQQHGAIANRKVYYRRHHQNARMTVFEGGHEILHMVALHWLRRQTRGQAAVWDDDNNGNEGSDNLGPNHMVDTQSGL